MTGNLKIENDSYPSTLLKLPTTGRTGLVELDPNGNLWVSTRNDATSQYSAIILGVDYNNLNDVLLLRVHNDSGYIATNVLHTGNKPTGTYTGNGSATSRTIDTGGIGNYCFIGDAYGFGFAIASGNGIVCFDIYNGTISYIKASDGSCFANGTLQIATSSELLNKTGYVFNYQVL